MVLLSLALLLAAPVALTETSQPLAIPAFVAVQGNQATLARLADGTRIRCVSAEIGAEEFETEWGLFRCPDNPVVDLIDGKTDMKVLEMLRGYDYDDYLKQASKRGFLEPLLKAAKVKGKKAEAFDQALVLRTLENWGPYFDPIPKKVKPDERVEFLWEKLEKADTGTAALLTGRLMAELDRKLLGGSKKITLADLRRGLRDKNPELRRAAALVSARQQEMQIFPPMLNASVRDDHPAVRTTAANTLMALDQEKALSGFSRKLWHGKRLSERIAAAEHLGSHGDPLSIAVLMVPLKASTVTGGPASATAFFGRAVSVISDFDVEIAQAASIADPRVTVLQEGAALQVRVVSTRLVKTVMASLQQISHANPGPRAEDWLRWYEQR
jgi:HEAT repeat protein